MLREAGYGGSARGEAEQGGVVARLEVKREREQMGQGRGEGGKKRKETDEIGRRRYMGRMLTAYCEQRQTVVSQFYQLDRLVVEGQKTVGPPFSSSPFIVIIVQFRAVFFIEFFEHRIFSLGSDILL